MSMTAWLVFSRLFTVAWDFTGLRSFTSLWRKNHLFPKVGFLLTLSIIKFEYFTNIDDFFVKLRWADERYVQFWHPIWNIKTWPFQTLHIMCFCICRNLVLIDFSYSSEHSALFHVRHHIDHKGSEEHLGNISHSLPCVQVLEHSDQIPGSNQGWFIYTTAPFSCLQLSVLDFRFSQSWPLLLKLPTHS